MYVAVIEIYSVDKENPEGTRGVDRNKVDIGRVVLRSSTTEGLRRKCQMGIDTVLYDEAEQA